MKITTKQLYHFWWMFSRFIKPAKDKKTGLLKDNKKIVKAFETTTFEGILNETYHETPNESMGYADYVEIANMINSGEITFRNWVYIMIGDFCQSGKVVKKNILSPTYVKKIVKLYTVNEINKQKSFINKLLEESAGDDPFTEFSDAKFDLYQVNTQQKNKLYELVKEGKLNFWFYLQALDNKFKIDETKCDPDFYRFVRLMRITRQNIKAKQ